MGKSKGNYGYVNIIAIIACIAVVVVIFAVILIGYVFYQETPNGTGSSSQGTESVASSADSEPTSEESRPIASEEESSSILGQLTFKTVETNEAMLHRGNLILVNADHPYVFSPAVETLNVFQNKTNSYKTGDLNVTVASNIMTDLNTMLDALYSATGSNALTITTGFTTEAEQETKYNAASDKTDPRYVAPGTCDLHTGLSFRATIYPSTEGSLTSGKFLWLAENCKNYGFVLRYPDGKDGVTGLKSSAEIFRYVGIPHAYAMSLGNYTLEEYLTFLQSYNTPEKGYTVTVNGVNYLIYYQAGNNILVPENSGEYTLSGDNQNGFVITVALS